MSPNLSTPIQRAVFALPLLAIALAAGLGAGSRPPAAIAPATDGTAHGIVVVVVDASTRPADPLPTARPPQAAASPLPVAAPPAPHAVTAPQGAAATLPRAASPLPGDSLLATGVAAKLDCDVNEPAGARGLARMPGDISTFAGRMRCAQ